jgi:hypothetical protein
VPEDIFTQNIKEIYENVFIHIVNLAMKELKEGD